MHKDVYVDLTKKCEDCKNKTPNYGTWNEDGSPNRRWCKPCADKSHKDIYVDFQQKCEDCTDARPNYGTRNEDGSPNRRWCKACADKSHKDVYVDFNKRCEDCQGTQPSYGTWNQDGSSNRRWCKPCADKLHKNEHMDFNLKCTYQADDLKCQKYAIAGTGMCTRHQPDYLPSRSGASRDACAFLDRLASELKLPSSTSIQHIHYDRIAKTITGDEYYFPESRRHADGYLTLEQCSNVTTQTVLQQYNISVKPNGLVHEYLGDEYHGNPGTRNQESYSYTGKSYKQLYEETMQRLSDISKLGYTVVYVWESDYKHWCKQVGTSLLASGILRVVA